jgi:hypothetical protein
MDDSGMPRRQFLAQSGAVITAAAALSDAWLAQAFAAGPGDQIVPWSDPPPAEPAAASGLVRICSTGRISAG